MDVLCRFEAGESVVNIGKALNLSAATVRTIRANADKIKTSVGSSSSFSAAKTSHTRSRVMLAIWI
jgi:DNA-binding NarL/FixJ family response regulator